MVVLSLIIFSKTKHSSINS